MRPAHRSSDMPEFAEFQKAHATDTAAPPSGASATGAARRRPAETYRDVWGGDLAGMREPSVNYHAFTSPFIRSRRGHAQHSPTTLPPMVGFFLQ
jgi:hypothetical protein